MTQIQNAMEIFKQLDKSNCRKCNETTCLAFAAAVFQGTRQIDECPSLDPAVVARYEGGETAKNPVIEETKEAIASLKRAIGQLDLARAARRLGGKYADGKLTLRILGKELSVDSEGRFYSDIHVHVWVEVPVLRYILEGEGRPVGGDWVPLRELEGGKDWYRLFGQRCEKPIKKVADTYTDLFEDMVQLFNARQVGRHFDSDISVVLHPLPLVPILICYWKPEDGLESDLHLFFDATAEANLHIEALYTLGAGLAQMFEKIALRHG
jgi:hypothetical protein